MWFETEMKSNTHELFLNSCEMSRMFRSDQHHLVEQKVSKVTQMFSAPLQSGEYDAIRDPGNDSMHLQWYYGNPECAGPAEKYHTAIDIGRIVAKCLKFRHCQSYLSWLQLHWLYYHMPQPRYNVDGDHIAS